jgi:hypothetical protein
MSEKKRASNAKQDLPRNLVFEVADQPEHCFLVVLFLLFVLFASFVVKFLFFWFRPDWIGDPRTDRNVRTSRIPSETRPKKGGW